MAVTINGTTGIDTPSLTADTTTLVVDETNNRVGIGTASPDELLELSSNTDATIKITSTDTALLLNEVVGAIEFETADSSNSGIAAKIEAIAENASGEIGISFSTGAGGSAAEAVRIDRDKNLKFNSGFGSVATAYGCRAWVYFDGTAATVTPAGSGNVSSITDHGGAQYTVNFSTAMPDTNYTAVGSCYDPPNASSIFTPAAESSGTEAAPTTTTFRFCCIQRDGGVNDTKYTYAAFFR